MADIYLVRHGQDEDNANGILNGRRDMPLTDLGRSQASTVAKKLKDAGITIIYASPLLRAYETAQIIAKEIGVDEVLADNDLMERKFGVLTGKPVADIGKYTNKILAADKVNYFLEGEGSEDFPTLYQRARSILKKIQDKHPDEHVLLVTHGDIGKMIRAAYHNWTWGEGLRTPYFDNTGVLELRVGGDEIE
jgi:probable phosphoglycerate mutase